MKSIKKYIYSAMKKIFLVIILVFGITLHPILSGASERISTSQTKTGVLAEGMKKEFEFYGNENESILITLSAEDELRYVVQIFSRESTTPLRQTLVFPNEEKEVIFTPPKSQIYTIRLTGAFRYGDYRFEIRNISNKKNPQIAQRIGLNQTKKTAIAEGQAHRYEFYGKENTPLIFYSKSDGNVWYSLQIIDPETETVLRQKWVRRNEWEDVIFTPQESKIYLIKITGAYSYGEYFLNMQKIPTR